MKRISTWVLLGALAFAFLMFFYDVPNRSIGGNLTELAALIAGALLAYMLIFKMDWGSSSQTHDTPPTSRAEKFVPPKPGTDGNISDAAKRLIEKYKHR
jgi:uncharacterized membrane protein YebE (DUF533 family)